MSSGMELARACAYLGAQELAAEHRTCPFSGGCHHRLDIQLQPFLKRCTKPILNPVLQHSLTCVCPDQVKFDNTPYGA